VGDVHRESGRYEGDGKDYSTSKMGSRKSAPSSSKAKDDAPKEQAKTANEKG
jgi:hypothetical protein